VIIAAIVTPTPDVFNLMLFAIPMCMLYFVGLFLGYLLVLKREGRRFPWLQTFLIVLGVLIVVGILLAVAVGHYHYHGYRFIDHWPFLTQ
jgi:sec-independent protein translocase protein TatC